MQELLGCDVWLVGIQMAKSLQAPCHLFHLLGFALQFNAKLSQIQLSGESSLQEHF
jgi:hypothetical protein